MSQIPATTRQLKACAAAMRKDADTLNVGNASMLLRFYSVECAMKERYLTQQRASPHGDTSMIDGAFGSSGHDLDAGRKALKAPAALPAAPQLKVTIRKDTRSVAVESAHQVWRYGIGHEGAEELDSWLRQVHDWMDNSR